MKKKIIKPRVFVTGSLWSLLIYLLVNDLSTIKRTHYFFTNKGVHPSVRSHFRHHVINISWDDKIHWRIVQFCFIFIPLYNILRWPYLLFSDIWGIDQGYGIQSIIGRNKYTLIEDGSLNYQVSNISYKYKHSKIHKLLWGDIYCNEFGHNRKCKRIILTKYLKDSHIQHKIEFVNLPKLWEQSTKEKQEYILNCFNLTKQDVEIMLAKEVILLTQPIAKDCGLTEEEQIQLYRDMIEPYKEENIIIKPHPRENTPYRKYFPHAVIMDKAIPFQLFELLGVKFKVIVTISSTAAMDIKNKDTFIDFKGTTIDERISKVYGKITKESLMIN